jgi:hypothetical protein
VAKPALLAMGNYNLIVFFVLLIGVRGRWHSHRVRFRYGHHGLSALATTAPLMIVVSRMDEGMSSLIPLSVPLFVLLGSCWKCRVWPRP